MDDHTAGWDRETLLTTMRGYMAPCVLGAAAKLDLFTAIGERQVTAEQLTEELETDARGLSTLLDALAAMKLLNKADGLYSLPQTVYGLLSRDADDNIHHAIHYLALLQERWTSIAEVVRTGVPYTRRPEYQAAPEQLPAFIEAMHVFTAPHARQIVGKVDIGDARVLLDVGGGPGTLTIAFLQANPDLSAVLFDRPEVLPIARRHLVRAEVANRVKLVGGSFHTDALPAGADVAWVSAIIHMNSREQNRQLFAKVHAALNPGGRIIIRDHVMDPSHTAPPSGALFAMNMLIATDGGGTYDLDQIREDLTGAGFSDVQLLEGHAEMDCLVSAVKT